MSRCEGVNVKKWVEFSPVICDEVEMPQPVSAEAV